MLVDWNVVATIAAPIIALFIGAGLNRFLENRPGLLVTLGMCQGISLSKENPPVQINTHSVVFTKCR